MKKFQMPVGLEITLLYLLFGGLWILFSDMILEYFVHDTHELTRLQNFKGWFYVLISGFLIYSLLYRYIRRYKHTHKQLKESEEQLLLAISVSKQGIFDLDVRNDILTFKNMPETKPFQEPSTTSIPFSEISSRIHPDDMHLVEKSTKDYLDGKTPQLHMEFRNKTGDANWRWVYVTGSIVERDQKGAPCRVVGIYMDISDKKEDDLYKARLLLDAQRRLERITSLREIDLEISSSSDLANTLSMIAENVKQHLNVDAVSILLFDEKTGVFKFGYGTGFETERIKNARVKMGDSFAGIAAQQNRLIHIHSMTGENIDEAFASLLAEENMGNYLGIPLLAKNNLVGVLELYTKTDIQPDNEWLEFFETLAGQAALAIENAQLIEGLEKVNQDISIVNEDLVAANKNITAAYDATIESLAMALNLRDYETEDHSRRVTFMMMELAEMMDFSSEEKVNIHRGTLLHDIGKLGVPDSILRKPGILTREERKIMQQHPVFAYNLLKSIEYLQPALDIPHLHHEKWDGTGYPYGLAGVNIPLAARLFAIVDVYDALTSDRPYRKAWTRETAISFIQDQKSAHFDPEIVDIFISYLEKRPDL